MIVKEDPNLTCDVCGKKGAIVGCSTLVAGSFAYCIRCFEHGAEPYGVLVGFLAMMSEGEWLKEEYLKEIVESTLSIVGKTQEDLEKDIRECRVKISQDIYG